MPEPRSGLRAVRVKWGWLRDVQCMVKGHDLFSRPNFDRAANRYICRRCGYPAGAQGLRATVALPDRKDSTDGA